MDVVQAPHVLNRLRDLLDGIDSDQMDVQTYRLFEAVFACVETAIAYGQMNMTGLNMERLMERVQNEAEAPTAPDHGPRPSKKAKAAVSPSNPSRHDDKAYL